MISVPAGAAGMEVRPIETMGGREVNDVYFTDCHLPADRLIGRAMAASNTLRAVAAPLGPLAAGLLLATVSPRLTIAALIAPTLIAAVLGTMSESIRQAPPLDELTKASPAASLS